MTYIESIELTVINCGECGGSYAINERYRKQKPDMGGIWHCPYCRTVIINGTHYAPLETLSRQSGDETAKAIVRAFISGWYNEPECHVNGGGPKERCDCSGCHLYRVAMQFLGGFKADEETDAGFVALWNSTK